MRGPVTAVAVFVILIARFASADVIELLSGERVEGAIQIETPEAIILKVGDQNFTIRRERIHAVFRGNATAAPSAGSPIGKAIAALRGLRSASEAGLTYNDYMPRVANAKIVIDEYLRIGLRGPGREAVENALDLYMFTSSVWSAKIQGNDPSIYARDPRARACTHLQDALDRYSRRRAPSLDRIVWDVYAVSSLWTCASEMVGAAERLSGAQ